MRRTTTVRRTAVTTTTSHSGLAPVSSLLGCLLLLWLCIVIIERLDVTNAIDPEYEPTQRIGQLLGALRNTWDQYRSTSGWPPPSIASATNAGTSANGARIGTNATTNANDGNEVIFRCRSAIDGQFVVIGAGFATNTSTTNGSAAPQLAVLIHGWFDSPDRRWVRHMANAYQRFVGGTFCTVDWSHLALRKYTMAAANTRVVAAALARFLRQRSDRLAGVTLIGHSFGAQIAGLTGRQLDGKVGQIFGLDPAGWMFTKPTMLADAERLDSGDAMYVQCVHTNGNLFGLGTDVPCGHQDFYPNGGLAPQPGCVLPREEGGMTPSLVTCSHYKSVQYFIASLNPVNEFKGWPCETGFEGWWRGLCAGKKFDYMGVHTRNRIGGKLYLETVKQKPFVYKTVK